MERRKFIKKSSALATLLSTGIAPGIPELKPYHSGEEPLFVGIQMGAHSFYDEKNGKLNFLS